MAADENADTALQLYGVFSESERNTFTDTLTAAKAISQKIRKDIYNKQNFKSGNKLHTKIDDEEAESNRRESADKEIGEIRKGPRSEWGERAIQARGHNCDELAAIAKLIAKRNNIEANIVSTNAHTFAVLGKLPESTTKLPRDMTKWSPDLIICDVWANIVCAANDYPDEFREKMAKWESDGKDIFYYHGSDDEGEWISPAEEQWISSVLNGRKYVDLDDSQ